MTVPAPLPPDEGARLAALRALEVLDTHSEPIFERLAEVAAAALGMPIALVSLVDADRQWFKANKGLPGVSQTPRDVAFCAHTILEPEVLVVEDASLDPRFRDNPLVNGSPRIRFYAGAPLQLGSGAAVGTLCVIDRAPRHLDRRQRDALAALAAAVVEALEIRSGLAEGKRAIDSLVALERRLAFERTRLANVIEGMNAGTWEWNVQTGEVRVNARWAAIVGYRLDELAPVSLQTWHALAHPDDLPASQRTLEAHFAGEREFYECQARMRHRDGRWIWVFDRGRVLTRTAEGEPEWMFGVHLEATAMVEAAEEQRRMREFLVRTGEVAGVGGWELDLKDGRLNWSEVTRQIHEVEDDFVPSVDSAIDFYAPEVRATMSRAVEAGMLDGQPWDLELPLITAKRRRIWVRAVGEAQREGGRVVRLVGAFQDITRRKAMEHALSESHERLRVTLESIGDAVITTDLEGRITWMNPIAEAMTGWSVAAARGKVASQVLELLDELSGERVDPISQCLIDHRTFEIEREVVVRGLERRTAAHPKVAPIRANSGEVLGAVVVIHDVSAERRRALDLRRRARHDDLTGLLNRGSFDAELEVFHGRRRDTKSTAWLLIVDLDSFKAINDTCGHIVGDRVLRDVALELKRCVLEQETVARLGGDEFALLLSPSTRERVVEVADQIIQALRQLDFVFQGRPQRVGASIGVAPIAASFATAEQVLGAADACCRRAKMDDRRRLVVWAAGDAALVGEPIERWETRLEHALAAGAFRLFGQRVQSLTGHGCRWLEVLPRLEEQGRLLLPEAFVEAAERFRLAARLDQLVIDGVVAELERRRDWLGELEAISVNLSSQALTDRAFRVSLVSRLRQASFAQHKLCFEIDETAMLANPVDTINLVHELRTTGVRIALDNFGGGATSIRRLRDLHLDLIKLDGRQTEQLDDPAVRASVKGLKEVGLALGVPVVAKGVETASSLDIISGLGFELAQGFHLHQPEPLDAVLAELAAPR